MKKRQTKEQLEKLHRSGVTALKSNVDLEPVRSAAAAVAKSGSTPDTARLKQEVLADYLNREDFSYDANSDALYRFYKDRYISQGRAAMEDTMGQAAALTGGYGSSYAQNVGQQAYNSHVKELNDLIPQLYQLAYDRYQDQGEELYRRYTLAQQQEQQEYDRGRDKVRDEQWNSEQQERQRQFDLNYDLNRQKQEEDVRQFNLNYGLKKAGSAGGTSGQDSGEPGVSYYAWLSHYQGQGQRPDPNDPATVTKYDNGKVSTANIMAMQRAIGAEDNGMWTAQNEKASGGLSADEAWAAFQKGQLQIRHSVDDGYRGVSEPNIMAMQRILGLEEDGKWDDADIKASGGLTAAAAWAQYRKGQLQNRRSHGTK